MKYVLLFILIYFPNFSHSQQIPTAEYAKSTAEQYVVNQWLPENGLPQTSVVDLFQDRKSYIWIASYGGLTRFDGVSFHTFNRSTNPEMTSDRVLNIAQDSSGLMWIGTESGAMSFANNTFTPVKIDFPLKQINSILVDGEGVVWIHQQNDRLYYIEKDSAIFVHKIKGISSINRSRKFVMSDFLHLIEYSKNKDPDTTFTFPKRLPINSRAMIQTKQTDWIIASNDSGLFRLKNSTLYEIKMAQGLPSSYSNRLFLDKSGTIWNLTNKLIYTISNESISELNTTIPMPVDSYLTFLQDKEGSIWIGSLTQGLFRLRKRSVQVIGKDQGMENDNLLSISFDSEGTLWFSTNCNGISRFKNGKVEQLERQFHLDNNCPWSILFDFNKNLYVASNGITVFSPEGKRTTLDITNGLIDNAIYAMYQTRDSAIWVGTKKGISILKNRSVIQSFDESDGLVHNDVRVFHQANDGSIWVGTTLGISKFSKGIFTSYASIPGLNSHYIRAIAEEKNGVLWFGSYGGGIIRYKNNQFAVITTKNGLFDDIVSHLIPDDYGYFWTGSNRGISRISIQELNEVADGKLKKLQAFVIGKQDGLVNPETNGGFQPSAIKDKNGKLYFPTIQGIVVIDPHKTTPNTVIPNVVIEKLNYNQTSLPFSNKFEFDYNPFYLEIDYTALSFIEPSKMNFTYKLEGYDRDWIDAGTRRTAFYSNLPPGEFTFVVRASNNNGVWNEKGDSISITIHPPFWLKAWFQFLCVFIFISACISIYIWRINLIKKRQQLNQDFALKIINSQEMERRRIANELHDGVGQYMTVIKNQLIVLKNQLKNNNTAEIVINEALQNSETAISDLRTIARDLRPVHLERFGITDTLRQLVANLITTTEMEINVEIEPIDDYLDDNQDIHVYRLVQESINNIYKHAKATQIDIVIQKENQHITFKIKDNGIGFKTDENFNGQGLIGMRERSILLGGNFSIESVPNHGTQIYLYIPILKS